MVIVDDDTVVSVVNVVSAVIVGVEIAQQRISRSVDTTCWRRGDEYEPRASFFEDTHPSPHERSPKTKQAGVFGASCSAESVVNYNQHVRIVGNSSSTEGTNTPQQCCCEVCLGQGRIQGPCRSFGRCRVSNKIDFCHVQYKSVCLVSLLANHIGAVNSS